MSKYGGDQRAQGPSTIQILGGVAITLIVFGSVVGLTLAGRPVDSILYLVPLIIAPTLVAFYAAQKSEKNTAVLNDNRQVLNDVAEKVNGRQDRLHNTVALLEHQLRQNGLTPLTDENHEGKHSDG